MMSEPSETRFVVLLEDDGRIDRVLARHFPEASRRRLAELFAEGAVRVDGKRVKKGAHAAPGAEVSVARPPTTAQELAPVGDPAVGARLEILYRDDDVVVVAKPAGMPSQPLRVGEIGTVASGLVALHPECARVADDPRDGGLVHRLDIGTSGVLVAARTRAAWVALRAGFSTGAIAKEYLALVSTAPVSTECDVPLAHRGGRVAVDYEDGLSAHTHWVVERRIGTHLLLRCYATTGRMHQVRVHLATCGAPIVGDELYGGTSVPGFGGFFLHAAQLRFRHPTTGEERAVVAPLPPDREAVVAALSRDGRS